MTKIQLKRKQSGDLFTIVAAGLLLGAVSPGTAGATVRHVPVEYPTIQAGIDASVTGDTVLVSPGTYQGTGNHDIVFHGRGVALIARDGPDVTVIDCAHAGRGFKIDEGEGRATRIEGLTIKNGYAPDNDFGTGGGIYCELTSPTIVNCKILDNYAFNDGGGVTLSVAGALMDRCLIAGNYGGLGGGVEWSRGFDNSQITNCVIARNWAAGGGGLSLDGPTTYTLTGCTVAGNLATEGGGIYCTHPLTLNRCILWGNCAFVTGNEMFAEDVTNLWCCDVDTTGVVDNWHRVGYRGCAFTNPGFCAAVPCAQNDRVDCTLNGASPCLPENSPCGQLIGALGQGCPAPPGTGACCLPDGTCRVESSQACEQQHGVYQGDQTPCQPNPCQPVPTKMMTWGQIKSTFRDATR